MFPEKDGYYSRPHIAVGRVGWNWQRVGEAWRDGQSGSGQLAPLLQVGRTWKEDGCDRENASGGSNDLDRSNLPILRCMNSEQGKEKVSIVKSGGMLTRKSECSRWSRTGIPGFCRHITGPVLRASNQRWTDFRVPGRSWARWRRSSLLPLPSLHLEATGSLEGFTWLATWSRCRMNKRGATHSRMRMIPSRTSDRTRTSMSWPLYGRIGKHPPRNREYTNENSKGAPKGPDLRTEPV